MKINNFSVATLAASLLVSSAMMTSCDKMLETKNFTDMVADNFFKSQGDFDAAVTALYLPLTTNWGYSDGGTGKWISALFCADASTMVSCNEYTTDCLRTYSEGNALVEFTFGPASNLGPWNVTFNMMRFTARATDVIANIEKSSASNAKVRNRYVAEAKILRAYYMFTLLDYFGPMNVKVDPTILSDNSIQPRPDLTTYLDYIMKDLDEAIACPDLPDKYNNDATNWGRMSKNIAIAIRMKVNMHQKNWSKTKEDAETLMKAGYSLNADYHDSFNLSATQEAIWSIPSNAASDNYYITEVLPSDFKKGFNHKGELYIRGNETTYQNGWTAYCMRWEFYDTFDDNDIRKTGILCEYITKDDTKKDRNSGMKGALPIKFTDTQFSGPGIQKEWPVVRYADVLLTFAEADNELNGPTDTAKKAVEQVRNRAGLTLDESTTSSKETFRDFILAERGRELYAEGWRRQDLIRHGKYISSAQARGFKAKDHMVLYPIPESAIIESNGVVAQNPGY